MKTLYRSLSLAVLLLAALPRPAVAQEKRVVKLATLAPDRSAWMNVFRAAAKETMAKTGNLVQIKIYGGGRRGDEKVVVKKMMSGNLDGAAITSVGLAQIAPEILVLQAPRLIRNYAQLDRIREKLQPRFEKLLLDKGFILLGWGDVGYTYLFSATPVVNPEDLKNTKPWVWASDPIMQEVYKQLGVSATPLPVPEVLQNLNSGLINCIYGSPLAAMALQWADHGKYITGIPLTIGVGATVVTKRLWDTLTDEQKKVVREVGDKWHKILVRKVRKDNDKSVAVLKEQKGFQIAKVDAAAAAKWNALAVKVQDALVGRVYPQSLLNEVRAMVK